MMTSLLSASPNGRQISDSNPSLWVARQRTYYISWMSLHQHASDAASAASGR